MKAETAAGGADTVEKSLAENLVSAFIAQLEDTNRAISHSAAVEAMKLLSLSDPPRWPSAITDHGFFSVITREFVDELLREISKRGLTNVAAIEVCAGRGALSCHLQKAGVNIVAIDDGSTAVTRNNLAARFDLLTHKQALEKYRPTLVIGCWIAEQPEIGRDILEFPSVNFFIDIGEPRGGMTWFTKGYNPKNFKLRLLKNPRKYTIGASDSVYCDNEGKVYRTTLTEVRLWERRQPIQPFNPPGISPQNKL